MEISDIIQEYGAYYKDSGQNKNRVLRRLTQPIVTTSYMTSIVTENTIYELAKSMIGPVIQGFQKGFTPKGALSFSPNKIHLRKLKIDLVEYPDDLEPTWLGFLASKSANRKDWPFVKWWIEQHVLPRSEKDREMGEYYNGVYKAPTVGEPSPVGTNLDGLAKLLQDGVNLDAENAINSLNSSIGPLQKDTMFDQVECAIDKVSLEYQSEQLLFVCSPEMKRAFLRDKRAQGFGFHTDINKIDNSIDFTPSQVVSFPGMSGKTDFFITSKENMFHCVKKFKNAKSLKIEEQLRAVYLMADWWEGIGFGINEAVWTNIAKTENS